MDCGRLNCSLEGNLRVTIKANLYFGSDAVQNSSGTKVMLHITKTAGGTLKKALIETKSIASHFVYSRDDLDSLRALENNRLDLVYGHTMFGVHSQVGLPEATPYMCFMRHPIARTISHYFHLRNVDKSKVGDIIRASKDINDFFENYKHWEFSNLMSKIISGVGNQPISEDVFLPLAIENLENQFCFVGFQEHFPLSMRGLSKVLGHEILFRTDQNVGRYKLDDVDPITIKRIEALNEKDLILYKFALQKFL